MITAEINKPISEKFFETDSQIIRLAAYANGMFSTMIFHKHEKIENINSNMKRDLYVLNPQIDKIEKEKK